MTGAAEVRALRALGLTDAAFCAAARLAGDLGDALAALGPIDAADILDSLDAALAERFADLAAVAEGLARWPWMAPPVAAEAWRQHQQAFAEAVAMAARNGGASGGRSARNEPRRALA